MDSTPHRGATVRAVDLSLKGPRGPVYRDVSFAAGPGTLVAFAGPSGSGRTCLLLTLTGRMRPTAGTAELDGRTLPRHAAAVRKFAALGSMPGINDLDPALTCGEHLRERLVLRGRDRRRSEAALAAVGLDCDALAQGERTRVADLTALDRFRLSLATALLGAPRLIAVDDIGERLDRADRAQAWRILRALAGGGPTVLAACADPEEADCFSDVTVRLDRDAAADGPVAESAQTAKVTMTKVTETTKGTEASEATKVVEVAEVPGTAEVAGVAGVAEGTQAAGVIPTLRARDAEETNALA